MMNPNRINELLDAFSDQCDIIAKQNEIIDKLFGLLSQHLSAEELAGLPVMSLIEEVSERTQ